MEQIVVQTGSGGWLAPAAYLALAGTAVSGAALVALHLVSPEFAPSWRMVSEYANGRYPGLLVAVFAGWAVSSFALLVALWPLSAGRLGMVALAFLALAGIGQTMGAAFDINHRLHGPAAMIGIPSLCVAAILVTIALSRHAGIQPPPLWSAHLPWISFVLMLVAVALLFSSLKAAGIEMSPEAAPLTQLPAGVAGYVGWANRLLFAASYLWTSLAALAVVRAGA